MKEDEKKILIRALGQAKGAVLWDPAKVPMNYFCAREVLRITNCRAFDNRGAGMRDIALLLMAIFLSTNLFAQDSMDVSSVRMESDNQLDQAFRLSESKQFEEALKITEQVIKNDPEYWKGYWRMGQIYAYMAKGEKAIPNFQMAEQFGLPDKYKETLNFLKIGAYISWGTEFQRDRDFKSADEKFQEAFAIAQNNNVRDMESQIELFIIRNKVNEAGGRLVPSERTPGEYDVLDPQGQKSMRISPSRQ